MTVLRIWDSLTKSIASQLGVRLIGVVFLTLILMTARPALAQTSDPCTFFHQLTVPTATESEFVSSVKDIAQKLGNVFQTSFITSINPEKQPYFTIDRGFSLVLSCSGDNPDTRLVRSLFYPVGLIVMPVGQREFTTHGKKDLYDYVITEYGLRLFIPTRNLRPMQDDSVYFFGSGAAPVPYCAGVPCRQKDRRDIDARYSYAIAKEKAASLGARIYEECGPWDIEPYYNVGTATEERNAQLSSCESPDARNGNLKIVATQEAKKLFDDGIDGTFLRLANSPLAKKIPLLISVKDCETKVDDNTVFSLGGSLNGDLKFATPAASFGSEIKAGIKFERQVVKTMPQGTFVLYSTYQVRGIPTIPDRALDIVSMGACKGTNPEKLINLNVFVGKDETARIPISGSDIQEKFTTLNLNGGLEWPVLEARQRLLGKYWIIGSYEQYATWESYLWDQLAPAILANIPEDWSIPRKKMMIDFFVHLVMADIFDFQDADAVKDEIVTLKNWRGW